MQRRKSILLLVLFVGSQSLLTGCVAMMAVCGATMGGGAYAYSRKNKKEVPCPVCQVKVRKKKAAYSVTYQGKPYYFDIEEHMQEFLKEPSRYTGQAGKKEL